MRFDDLRSNGFDEFPNNNIISEGGMSKVVSALSNKEFAVITAYRGEDGGRKIEKKENIQRNRQLRGDLNSRKMGGYPLVGHWQECRMTDDDGNTLPYDQCPAEGKVDSIERSYLVPKPKDMDSEEFKEFLVSLGRKYKQDAIVYADGSEIHVLYSNGGGESFGKVSYGKVAQAYSQHTRNTGVPFIFEGAELPGSNSGRAMFTHSGVLYPILEHDKTNKSWDTLLG